MTRRPFVALLLPVCAIASLFVGLAPTLLDQGRFDPLDWLLPGFGVLALGRFVLGSDRRRLILLWAMLVLPVELVTALAGSTVPWTAWAALALPLGLYVWLLASARTRWPAMVAGLALLAVLRFAVPFLDMARPQTPVGRVAVLSALPLFQSGAARRDPLGGVGERAPIILGLSMDWRVDPIEKLKDASLRGVERLLLAQPRLLAPAELVALDHWVRAGGTAMILADPYLQWAHDWPLGDPLRPPLTSLLDPLMMHWGLTLESASVGPVERRALAGGAMIQLASASHFVAAHNSPCVLAERGLIAYCDIGKGKAVLIADADWIDDRLWTTDPARPQDKRSWTSDALPMLSQLIAGGKTTAIPGQNWLISDQALFSALRWALGLIVLLGVALARVAPRPASAHAKRPDFMPRKEESGEPPPNSA